MTPNAIKVLATLLDHPNQTARQIAAALGIDLSGIHRAVRCARNEKMIYVSDWTLRGTAVAACYSVGKKKDVPRPAPKSSHKPVRTRPDAPDAYPTAETIAVIARTKRYIEANPKKRAFASMLGQMGAI